MDKDIRFTGYTAVPSDYESTDGELTQAHNLINEDGTFKSLLAPKVLLNLGDRYTIIFIHKSISFNDNHYIVQDDDNHLYWMLDGESLENFDDAEWVSERMLGNDEIDEFNVQHINSIGNTVIVFNDDGMNYFLWKGSNNNYKYLGTHLPECDFSFGLQATVVESDEFEVSVDEEIQWATIKDEYQSSVTTQVMAQVNKFIAEQATQKGRFIFPFFIRTALRLYDGSYTMQSAPVLMVCSTSATPRVCPKDYSRSRASSWTCKVFAALHELDYIVSDEQKNKLIDWSDIVSSVDVFISAPIYWYDGSAYITSVVTNLSGSPYSVCKLQSQKADATLYPNTYQYQNLVDMYSKQNDSDYGSSSSSDSSSTRNGYSNRGTADGSSSGTIRGTFLTGYSANIYFDLNSYSAEEMAKKFTSCANFYLLKSFKPKNLATEERTIIEVADDYLGSLVTRETLSDDYDSHDNLISNYSFTYNNRLNLTAIKKKLFVGFSPAAMLPYSNGVGYPRTNSDDTVTYADTQEYQFIVTYEINGDVYTLTSEKSILADQLGSRIWLYYPNTNATKIVIKKTVKTSTGDTEAVESTEYDLTRHEFLNGAYFFATSNSAGTTNRGGRRAPAYNSGSTNYVEDGIVDIPNKIYTSAVNNPFYFPVTGINTVGTGRILGISTAAKALSQGQFGQFPLYAFTDEGVWALEVSSSGGYSAKQPITRDVCISSDSITQIDSAVLFATDRGIMEISGSQTQCITDIINGDDFFALDRLPGLASLYPDGIPQIDCTFADYRKDARMAYDYINQRIIIFNANKSYAYVYSMKSKLWGIIASSLQSALNSYPEAYAMATIDGDNCLVDISRSIETSAKGLLVTRPIKLEAGSMLKTFDTVFLRGLFRKDKVQTVLYGSRDNINWHLIHSAKQHYLRGFRGSPYKYFRIVAITNLAIGETLLGASVQYTPRLTNKMR